MTSTQKDKVSIIIPVYNMERYLRECLDSVENQTYRNLEIIVIDDGSTDSSATICDEYGKKDSRFKVIHQKNSGLSVARNTGLDVATGNFITFLDSDDWFALDLIKTQLETITKWNADIAICRHESTYKNARIQFNQTPVFNFIEDYGNKKDLALSQNKWLGSGYSGGWTQKKLMKSECLIDKNTRKKIYFYANKEALEDELFTLQIFKNTKRVAFNTNSVFFYRMRNSSFVHEVSFPVMRIRTRILMREKKLIDHKDMLVSNIQVLLLMKLVNPSVLNPKDKELFFKTVEWCRNHINEIMALKFSPLKKLFIYLYLKKWPTFSFKRRLCSLFYPPYKMLFGKRDERKLEFFENK